MSFIDGLHNRAKEIDAYLETLFRDSSNQFEASLYEAMRYSLLAGGKRIRPVILVEIGRLFKANIDELLPFAAGLEMIHTYSLIHDDLPAMDDDDLRRGIKTNHIVYGEALAILAGDSLLNSAYELLTEVCFKSSKSRHIEALMILSKAGGRKGMISGQVADIQSENQEADKDTLDYIHQHKTSALLTAPFVMGGLIGQADQRDLVILEQLGQKMGLIFQITDDILDIESNEEKLGKPIGSDEKNKKMTYPAIYGLDQSKLKVKSLHEEAIELLSSLDQETEFLEQLLNFFTTRDY